MPSVIKIPFGRSSEKTPRWDLIWTEGCCGGKAFLWLVIRVWEYIWIYRPRKEVSGLTRGPQGQRARPWAPRAPSDLILAPIYSHISPNQQSHPRKHFSAAATFYTREIPSSGLFWHPAGGGFVHGGLLHQLYYSSDEAWVVYLIPTGPYLVARWFLLSLWFSIPCFPRCSWRSIWCNIL